jgi:hypothetical protein
MAVVLCKRLIIPCSPAVLGGVCAGRPHPGNILARGSREIRRCTAGGQGELWSKALKEGLALLAFVEDVLCCCTASSCFEMGLSCLRTGHSCVRD